jgi:hypothetical protein
MIIGGVAASLLGRPRLTADVDVIMLLSVEELPELIAAAEEEGFVPRIQDAGDFARHHHVLLLRHPESGINADISSRGSRRGGSFPRSPSLEVPDAAARRSGRSRMAGPIASPAAGDPGIQDPDEFGGRRGARRGRETRGF